MAEKIARSLLQRRSPWPPWSATPRVLQIATRKVADLSGDPAERLPLLEVFLDAARRRYEELRVDGEARRVLMLSGPPRQ